MKEPSLFLSRNKLRNKLQEENRPMPKKAAERSIELAGQARNSQN